MGKLLAGVGIVVLLLVVGGAGAVWYFLSRFDARAEIERRVEAATGRDFALTGPVSVSFWPAIGFRGEGAKLANVAGGRAPYLLEAKAITIGVALRPLLDKRVEVSRFVLTEPVLSLEMDAEARPNWILKPVTPGPTRPPAGQPGGQPARVNDLKLAATIEDGSISYVNARTRSAYALSDMDLKVGMEGLDKALHITGALTYRDKSITTDTTVGSVRAIMTGQTTPLVTTLESDLFRVALKGAFTVDSGALAGDITASGPSLRNLASWAGAPLGAGYGLEPFALSGKLDVGPKRYAFENAGLMIDTIKARGDFTLETGRAVPFLSGRLEIVDAAFDPLSGAGEAGRPVAARMAIDLNPYFSAPQAAGAAVEVSALQPVNVAAPGWSEARLNFGWMKRLNTNLEITTGPLRYQNIQFDTVALSLTMLDGYLAATMQRMELYGGNGSARVELDARQPQVVFRNELAVQNLKAKDFFRDAFGFQNLDGVARLDWGFGSRGASQKEMMGSLAGDGKVAFANGALTGVDLGGVARTIRSAMRGELVSKTATTPFTSLTASIRAADGVIAAQDVALAARDARLTAQGVVDARNRNLDFRVVPRLGSMGLAVPFRVSGPWGRFAYASDMFGRARGAEAEAKARAVPSLALAR